MYTLPIIEIKKPCHENLNNMAPNSEGRFCGTCQTSVIDFTDKSPNEISDFFKNNKREKLCGIFNSEVVKTESIIDNFIYYLFSKKIKFLALFIVSILIVSGCKTKKQGKSYGTSRILDKKNESIESIQ